MSRPIVVTIGLTLGEGAGYVPILDGYRPGARQVKYRTHIAAYIAARTPVADVAALLLRIQLNPDGVGPAAAFGVPGSEQFTPDDFQALCSLASQSIYGTHYGRPGRALQAGDTVRVGRKLLALQPAAWLPVDTTRPTG